MPAVPSSPLGRPLWSVAQEIHDDWAHVSFEAMPYLLAMSQLEDLDDYHDADRGDVVVAYFLSNTGAWTGPCAEALKAELETAVWQHMSKH